MQVLKRTWAEISVDALAHNVDFLKNSLPSGCRFLGVVKADAYGHGAVTVSRELVEMGADFLAVSNLEEAMQLRRSEIQLPVLIMGYTPPQFARQLAVMDICQEVNSLDYAIALSNALKGSRLRLTIHLKLDTGMGRLGLQAYDRPETIEEIRAIAALPGLILQGTFMHFAVADSLLPEHQAFTRLQYERFTAMLKQMADIGIVPEIRHCCNSAATLLYPEFAMDMVRPGIATYGMAPSEELIGRFPLQPLMSLHTTISQIRDFGPDIPVSYGCIWKTDAPRKIAVLPIGYADGFSRNISGKAFFLVNGVRVPQVGRICMDMCMADITDVPDASVGDEVTVVGRSGDSEISWDEFASLCGTISYERLCAISKRVPRVYTRNGSQVEYLDQLGVYD